MKQFWDIDEKIPRPRLCSFEPVDQAALGQAIVSAASSAGAAGGYVAAPAAYSSAAGIAGTGVTTSFTAGQALAAGGVATGGVGTIASINQAGQLGSYNQQVLAAQRQQAIDAAASAEATRRFQVKRLIGTQAAGYAGSGLSYEGSPLAVVSDTARQGELDALRIRYGGQIGDYSGAAAQGQNVFETSRAKTSAELGFGNTLLTGASLLSGKSGRA